MFASSIGSPLAWGLFLAFVLGMLALDLGVFHRRAHQVRYREALAWSGVWIGLALIFGAGVWMWHGPQRALEYLAGFAIEKALAVDNIFVIAVILSAFAIPAAQQHRVLFYGVLGALVLRAGFILAGGAFLNAFHWGIYAFGALLIITGIKLLVRQEEKPDPERNPLVRLARRFLPVSTRPADHHFVVREATGRLAITPLLLALIAVEVSDVVFAVDSIPAIFAVTRDPFIVFTSNIFALLGLRSLYFVLAGIMDRFRYLNVGLALVLIFVGAKMALADVYKVPIGISLGVIALLIGASIMASMVATRKHAPDSPARTQSGV